MYGKNILLEFCKMKKKLIKESRMEYDITGFIRLFCVFVTFNKTLHYLTIWKIHLQERNNVV